MKRRDKSLVGTREDFGERFLASNKNILERYTTMSSLKESVFGSHPVMLTANGLGEFWPTEKGSSERRMNLDSQHWNPS